MQRGIAALLMLMLTGCHAFYKDTDGLLARRPTPANEQLAIDPALQSALYLSPAGNPPLVTVAAQKLEEPSKTQSMMDRLKLKGNIPGADAPDIKMPLPTAPRTEIETAIKKQFPPLPALPVLPRGAPGAAGVPLTLDDLQQIASRSSPVIRQANFDIDAARGLALQAGLYPNPSVGYESSDMGQGGFNGRRTIGMQGGYLQQTILMPGKLGLARAAAIAAVQVAEQNLLQKEADLNAVVRQGYFAVLTARTQFDVVSALVQTADELYSVLLLQMQAGEVAAYEPMQIRVLALQARGQLVKAHNRYVSAWRQLAADMGTPGMPLTALAGRIDLAVPLFEHDRVLHYVLEHHTEVQAARINVERGKTLVRLAQLQPYPDLSMNVAVQKDYTTPPFEAVTSVTVGAPFPLWNRNQGNIQYARAQLRRALEETDRVRNDLTSRTAEVFERYENNRTLLEMYKNQILPNQVQAFRAAVIRHAAVKDVSYNDIVTVQQSLASTISTYLSTLGEQWVAVIDIAHLLQCKDLYQFPGAEEVAPIPQMPSLLPAPSKIKKK
jgi:cobalt-zinc-cadmium efflux system outer membrane protein